MAQLSINKRLPGLFRGQLVGSDHRIVSRENARDTKKTVSITYSAAQTHTLVIAGIPFDGGPQQQATLTITGATDSNTTAANLLAAIKANPVANSIVSGTRSTNVLTLTARRAGGLTVTGSATGGAATTVAASTSEEPLEAGVAVVRDTSGDKRIRKPFAPTGKSMTVTVNAATNAKNYAFALLIKNGSDIDRVTIRALGDGSATANEVAAALAADVEEQNLPVSAAVSGAVVTLTNDDTAIDFDVTEADAQLDVATVTAR
jgi:hypothetical protein